MPRRCKCDMAGVSPRAFMLVTGGAGGIGSAVCRLLPSIGITPIIAFNSNKTQANLLAKELDGFAVQIDMKSDSSIKTAIEGITAEIGASDRLEGIILGASPPPELEAFKNISVDHLSLQFRVNVIGSQLLLQGLILNFFRKSKSGTIIGISTKATGTDELPPATGMGAYVVAKAAFESMLAVCSAEYSWLKIRTIYPGFTYTPMLDVFDSKYLEMVKMHNKISTAEETAELIIESIKS